MSISGIILGEPPKNNEGKVVAVGPGLRDHEGAVVPMNVNIGDLVYLPDYGGVKLNADSQEGDGEYTLYREDELLGTLSPDEV